MFNTSDELFDALKHVTIGGNVCVYTKERCEEMLPLIQDIHRLKEEKNVFAIGVGFEGQMIERVPHAKHDIRLDAVLTEGGVFIMEENI